MSVQKQITKELHKIYTAGEVSAGQLYKSTDFDGVVQNTGWWFRPFNNRPLWLGKSKNEAFEIIEQIENEREY